MTSLTSGADLRADAGSHDPKPKLDQPTTIQGLLIFMGITALGLSYTAWSIYRDLQETGAPVTSILPFILLGVALLVALGFEFVNGFHDTANAVATVIYTHSLPAECRGGVVGRVQFPRRSASRPARSPSASSRCCRSN